MPLILENFPTQGYIQELSWVFPLFLTGINSLDLRPTWVTTSPRERIEFVSQGPTVLCRVYPWIVLQYSKLFLFPFCRYKEYHKPISFIFFKLKSKNIGRKQGLHWSLNVCIVDYIFLFRIWHNCCTFMEYLSITGITSSSRLPAPMLWSVTCTDRFPRKFGLLLVSPWPFFQSALPP
jgi:hypothetical protein